MRNTIHEIAIINDCDLNSLIEVEPHFPPRRNSKLDAPEEDIIDCFEYTKGCKARVAFCEYDGGHYTWPLMHLADLTYWFYPFLTSKRLDAFGTDDSDATTLLDTSKTLKGPEKNEKGSPKPKAQIKKILKSASKRLLNPKRLQT